MVLRRILLLAVTLLAAACDSGSEPGERPSDAGTGGLATGGAAGAGVTGGSSGTGGVVTATGGQGQTGGAVATGGATGGAKTGGASGTGGAPVAVQACGIPEYAGHEWPVTGATVYACSTFRDNDFLRIRFTADGRLCGTCWDAKLSKAVASCSTKVLDPRTNTAATSKAVDLTCVGACSECPVEKCFSTGSDFGTEYPCS